MKHLKRIKNGQFLLDAIDVETAILDKATQIAEKIITATLREKNRKEDKTIIDIDLDQLAMKIADKINIQYSSNWSEKDQKDSNVKDFNLDTPINVIHKTADKIHGLEIETKKSKDSTIKNLEALEGLNI